MDNKNHDPQNIDWSFEIIERKADSKFYGTVMFSFQNGKIQICKQEESFKPPS